MAIEILREVTPPDSPAKQVLVTDGERHWLVSSVIGHDHGKAETLVFACDDNAVVSSWSQVAGGVGQSRSQAVADLERRIANNTLGASDLQEAFLEEVGGPISMMVDLMDGLAGLKSPRAVDDDFLK